MKLYTSIGPNPRIVNMFAHEANINLATQEIDIISGENRQADFLTINPSGQLPVLETDSGNVICEVLAICLYLDEVKNCGLFGSNPDEKASTLMWWQRCQLRIAEPAAEGFRWGEGFDYFRDRIFCAAEASAGLKAKAQDGLQWFEKLLTGNWIAGERFSAVDVYLYCMLDFLKEVGQPLAPEYKNIHAWMARVQERPSAQQTSGN